MECGPKVLECRNHRNGAEHAKMCEVSGIALLRLGSNISAQIMSAKNGVSVMERNSIPPSRTSSRGPIEFHGRFGLGWDRNLGAADIKRVQFVGSASLLLFRNVLASREA